ncbi:uncharacterized protein J3R85_001149 [Psidium guajava]|nr:uncharacterized protein J3R85_001149 [Psidium guajava]
MNENAESEGANEAAEKNPRYPIRTQREEREETERETRETQTTGIWRIEIEGRRSESEVSRNRTASLAGALGSARAVARPPGCGLVPVRFDLRTVQW